MANKTLTNLPQPASGLGDREARVKVYIANRPNYQDYPELADIRALKAGEIDQINLACGNGWRKVFNVYAKLLFAFTRTLNPSPIILPGRGAVTWQDYRDKSLLQAHSATALLFSAPVFNDSQSNDSRSHDSRSHDSRSHDPRSNDSRSSDPTILHIVSGRTYANSLQLPNLIWLDPEFACAPAQRLLVCPYFDYRQLSDSKILRLVQLIGEVMPIKLA